MDSVRFDPAVSQQLFQILTKASLETFSQGDILQGRVLELQNSLLLIKLLDGSSFTAKVPENFMASAGELITLEIDEKQGDQLTARILTQETAHQKISNVDQEKVQLKDSIIQGLESQGISPTEKLISDVFALMKADSDISLKQAAFFVGNKMELSSEMLKILQKISENEFMLHENLQSIKDGLLRGLAQMGGEERKSILKPIIISQELENLSAGLNEIITDIGSEAKKSVIDNISQLLTKTLLSELNSEKPVLLQKDIENSIMQSENDPLIEEGSALFKPHEIDLLLKSINKALEDIHTKILNKPDNGEKEIEEILEELFDKAVIKAQGGEIQDQDISIKEKAQALKKIMEVSQNVIDRMDRNTQELILPVFKEIGQAFNFFSQVTTYDSMIQIPLKINRENTSGELYVMKRRKGHKKLDGNNFTLFLTLRTSNLGRVESFMNASNKYVTISFRVEDEELLNLVKDEHRALYDGLADKGYKLAELKCKILDENKTDVFDAAVKTGEILGLQAKMDIKI